MLKSLIALVVKAIMEAVLHAFTSWLSAPKAVKKEDLPSPLDKPATRPSVSDVADKYGM